MPVRLRRLACILPLAFAAAEVDAVDLARVLACQDRSALESADADLDAALRSRAADRCRVLTLRSGTALECDLDAPLTVAGLATREIGSARDRDGARRVRSVFRASASRVRDTLSARGLRFEAVDEDRRSSSVGIDGRLRVEVSAREDGSSVLACVLAPLRDEAGDLALGIDAQRGGLSGRTRFPGGALPATRVCAVPRAAVERTRCVLVPRGRDDYLLTGLPAGEYDVVTWALEDNPNGWYGAHAVPLEDCAPHQPGCAGGLLVPVDVRAGAIRTDIDPDRVFTQLPARLAAIREADGTE
jgi:hypothetical protein